MRKFLKSALVATSLFGSLAVLPSIAKADVTIFKGDDWEVYTNGRVGTFAGYSRGDGFPADGSSANGNIIRTVGGAGLSRVDAVPDALLDENGTPIQGQHEEIRVRSGFVSNILAFGLRRQLTPDTTLHAYTALWNVIETENRRKFRPAFPDFRQGYLKLEGPWGSFLAGRELTLFDRGATTITFLYGFNYGLGFPGSVDIIGPAAGHIGYGVLANGFAAGFVYATPKLAGLQLSVGVYDPASLVGSIWERTRYPRPEGELTYEVNFGSSASLNLFVNGTWQELLERDGPAKTSAVGVGYGGRIEVGPVHLGLAGHRGRGLGLFYALEPSEATYATNQQRNELRDTDGMYAQLQIALGKIDLMGGVGQTRVFLLDSDRQDLANDDNDVTTPPGNDDGDDTTLDVVSDAVFVPKRQLGFSGGVWYHATDYLHVSLDVFRADIAWFDQPIAVTATPEQKLWFVNAGVTAQW